MDFLGIGPLELIFILIIALLILGPKQMVKTGGSIGEFIRKFVNSDSWKAIRMAQREMRSLPNKLAKEAGINDWDGTQAPRSKDVKKTKPVSDIGNIMPELDAWTNPPEEGDIEGEKGEKVDKSESQDE
jgi:Sec-independent protein translocase protein TatA